MWFSLPWFIFSFFLTIVVFIKIIEINCENIFTHPDPSQQIILYGNNRERKTNAGNNNTYKNEKYMSNTKDLEKISRIIRDGRLKSACVQVGLWAIFYGKHYTNIASILYASSDSDDRTCTQNKINDTHYSSYQSIRYIGNSNLKLSAISLYSGKFFSGEELYFDGNILSLPNIQEFNSYGFTGNENWTLFSNQNFYGHSICLVSKDINVLNKDGNRHNKDGIIYNKIYKNPIQVGSIIKGCIEQSNRTIIYPNGETIVQWTTKPKQLYEKKQQNHTNKYIKLYSEFIPDTDELITDAKELRLPSTYSFPSYTFGLENSNWNNWTIFSGNEYNGQAKCFFTDNHHNIDNDEDESPAEIIKNDTSANSNGTTTSSNDEYIIIIGSIKEGCIDPIKEPVLEQHQLPKLEIIIADNPGNSLFFTSFIIGLIIFILIILVSIFLIIYFYCSSKRRKRQRRQ